MKNYYTIQEIGKMSVPQLLLILSCDIWEDAKRFYTPRLSQRVVKSRKQEEENVIKRLIFLTDKPPHPAMNIFIDEIIKQIRHGASKTFDGNKE